ncbi:hypothetical protein [Flavobacterium hydatis]|jgi:hypothetical protein|uniref:hypothetical protein n=1 Tax=Flavobacterium hydatis TaxID=991 RepID=UPI000AF91BA6|nr:hypothetical protein [Flavobacterium hydatis]
MKNLKNLNFTELSRSEMKQVQGGGWLDDVLKVVQVLEPLIIPIVKVVGGGK